LTHFAKFNAVEMFKKPFPERTLNALFEHFAKFNAVEMFKKPFPERTF
jgi:hypothetical protein